MDLKRGDLGGRGAREYTIDALFTLILVQWVCTLAALLLDLKVGICGAQLLRATSASICVHDLGVYLFILPGSGVTTRLVIIAHLNIGVTHSFRTDYRTISGLWQYKRRNTCRLWRRDGTFAEPSLLLQCNLDGLDLHVACLLQWL